VTETAGDSFGIGRVIGRTFDAIRANLVIYLGVGLVLLALPEALASYVVARSGMDTWASLRISNLLSATVGLLATLILMHAAMRTLSGKTAEFGDSLAAGFRLFFPGFGISWLTNLGVIVGLVLLIVPGIILAIWWCVALPARIAEGEGVMAAIGRSRALTKGWRWHILGLFAIAAGAFILLFIILGVAAYITTGSEESPLIDIVVTPLATMLTTFIGAAGAPAIYHELIRLKGGRLETADVFA